MAKVGNRVKETSATTGTGTLDLAGAPTGFRGFGDEFTSGDSSISYLCVDDVNNPTEYEYGKGTFTSGTPDTFARDTVEGSSNAGAKVSWVSGCTIISTPTAADFAALFALLSDPTLSGATKIAGSFALTGDISPSQITADQNDYNPTSLSSSSVLRLNSDAARTITGLQGGADGRTLILHNVGSFNITLKDESASSTAANRFALLSDALLAPDQSIALQYDSTSSRWRLVGAHPHPVGQTPGTTTNDAASAGNVGEYVSSSVASGSGIALTTITPARITSISLTAGDWDVWLNASFNGGASTTVDYLIASISTTDANISSANGFIGTFTWPSQVVLNNASPTVPVGPVRFTLSATTTIYANVQAKFATSTCNGYGIIQARRVR